MCIYRLDELECEGKVALLFSEEAIIPLVGPINLMQENDLIPSHHYAESLDMLQI